MGAAAGLGLAWGSDLGTSVPEGRDGNTGGLGNDAALRAAGGGASVPAPPDGASAAGGTGALDRSGGGGGCLEEGGNGGGALTLPALAAELPRTGAGGGVERPGPG